MYKLTVDCKQPSQTQSLECTLSFKIFIAVHEPQHVYTAQLNRGLVSVSVQFDVCLSVKGKQFEETIKGSRYYLNISLFISASQATLTSHTKLHDTFTLADSKKQPVEKL